MLYETYSAEETAALGEKIGKEAQAGEGYTLIGDGENGVYTRNGGRTWNSGTDLQSHIYDRTNL